MLNNYENTTIFKGYYEFKETYKLKLLCGEVSGEVKPDHEKKMKHVRQRGKK